MKTIPEIKALCREIIKLGEQATSAPWTDDGTGDMWHEYDTPRHGIDGCHVVMGRMNKVDFEFIAVSRTFSPQAAHALLSLIAYVEDECPIDLPQEKLNEICKLFP